MHVRCILHSLLYAMVWRLSVTIQNCVCVEAAEWIQLVSARRLPSLYPMLCCKGIRVSPKIGVLSFGSLTQTLIFLLFHHGISTVASVVSLVWLLQVCHTEHPTLFATHWLWHGTLHGLSVTAETSFVGSRPSDHYFRTVCLFVCLFVQSFSQPFLIRFRSN